MPLNEALFRRRQPLRNKHVRGLISSVLRNRRSLMNLKNSGVYLNIGCGPNSVPYAINLEYNWEPGVDACCDITKPLPIPIDYIGGVYTEHCIEHITLRQGIFAFREMFRVMKPGARLRCVVPDFTIYADAWKKALQTGDAGDMPYGDRDGVDGIYSPIMSINRIFRDHGHKFIYDFATLELILSSIGFTEIWQCDFRQGGDDKLLIDSPVRRVESLYVEAVKPS